jgi:hypothetical protein
MQECFQVIVLLSSVLLMGFLWAHALITLRTGLLALVMALSRFCLSKLPASDILLDMSAFSYREKPDSVPTAILLPSTPHRLPRIPKYAYFADELTHHSVDASAFLVDEEILAEPSVKNIRSVALADIKKQLDNLDSSLWGSLFSRGKTRAVLPKEPPAGLIASMVVRFDHGLGLDGYYDQPIFASSGLTHKKRRDGAIVTMQQLYEEVSGYGFFAWPECERLPAGIGPSQLLVEGLNQIANGGAIAITDLKEQIDAANIETDNLLSFVTKVLNGWSVSDSFDKDFVLEKRLAYWREFNALSDASKIRRGIPLTSDSQV